MSDVVLVAFITAAAALGGSALSSWLNLRAARLAHDREERSQDAACASDVMVALQAWSRVLNGFDGPTVRRAKAELVAARARLSVRLPASRARLDRFLDAAVFAIDDEADPEARERLASAVAGIVSQVVVGTLSVDDLPNTDHLEERVVDFWLGGV